jgi:hypothetical protein
MPLTPKKLALLLIILSLPGISAQSQTPPKGKSTPAQSPSLLKRSTSRYETRRFGYGGTLTIIGPPSGSIVIEGWQRSEIEIAANIEWQASSEQDLALLSAVNNIVLDEDASHFRILSTGTHDKAFMRRVAKRFPKNLIGLPWRIDYRIKVPMAIDLEINAGNGPITLTGVDGAVRINALESDTKLKLTGGNVSVTVLRGSIGLDIPTRSWRGSGAELKLATGVLTVSVPPGFNADIDADLLRLGAIENSYSELMPREQGSSTPRFLRARAGSGGATLNLTVGDGTIRIKKLTGD